MIVENPMTLKAVKDSSVTLVQQMTVADANPSGNIHGGVIMKLVDNAAYLVARRHTGLNVVTASIDHLDFHSPVFAGDLLRLKASINNIGKSSMEIGVRVEAEDVLSGEIRHTASAYLTYVALDENQIPQPIAPVVFETDKEKERNCAAVERRLIRFDIMEKMKNSKGGECS